MQVKVVEGVCVIEEEGDLEPGGVEIDWESSKWYMPFVREALAAMEGNKLTMDEAWNSEEHPEWRKAMGDEIQHIDNVGTWTPVIAPPGVNILKSIWVLVKKCDANGKV